MGILIPRQSEELHKAILQYLEPLFEEKGLDTGSLHTVLGTDTAAIPHYLEKKWATVLRLQKRILDLENEANSYKALLDQTTPGITTKDKLNWLPSASTTAFRTQSTQLVAAVTLHPSLPLVYAGCSDGTVLLWNLGDSTVPTSFAAHTRGINSLKWSTEPLSLNTDAKPEYVLASCSADLSIKIWIGDSCKHARTLTGHEHTVSAIAFAPSGAVLYSVSRDKAVRVWDLKTGYCTHKFVGHSDWVRNVDVAAVNLKLALQTVRALHGVFLLTCSNDQLVRLLHESGAGLALLLGHTHVVETVKFLPQLSNKHIDTYLRQNKHPYVLDSMVDDPVYNELGFKYCVSGGRDNIIKLWLLPPPTLRPHRAPTASASHSQGWHIADLMGHQLWVRSIEIHPNGRFLFSSSDDKTVRVWDLSTLSETGQVTCVRTLRGHEGFVSTVHFAGFDCEVEDGEDREKAVLEAIKRNMRCLLVSGGTDSTVRMWS